MAECPFPKKLKLEEYAATEAEEKSSIGNERGDTSELDNNALVRLS